MISAFCPAHITCFFQPVDAPDIISKGSRGAGIRLDKGAKVSLSENRSPHTQIIMDGIVSNAPVTRKLLDLALPGRGFEVTIENDLPTGQGFGMSAAGAIAAALCAEEIEGFGRHEAYALAHRAEVMMGGGLGDVSGIMGNVPQPVRIRAGLPPIGEVIGTDVVLGSMSVVILGPKMSTSQVLNDPMKYKAICEAGRSAVDDYLLSFSKESLYSISNRFSGLIGLQSIEMCKAMKDLKLQGISSGMCMLGNSIFVDSCPDVVSEIVGDIPVFGIEPTGRPAEVIQKV
ncbi:MAG: pantothenate kinase [Candidatus Methanogranum gryphiswaldense]|nr:MAG: pantothenate kinase [Candidatus Methanogranum sp. U3.2.1]